MKRFMFLLPLLFVVMPVLASPGAGMTLRVAAGDGHGHVRRHFVYARCGGDNVSPPVHWKDAPKATRSFVLTTFDPDANQGAGWWHWVVIDLPASTAGLGQGASLPAGARSLRNDFGRFGWGGPCPPAGDPAHHYVFTVYALNVARLPLPAGASPAQARQAMRGHVLAKATATFLYGR